MSIIPSGSPTGAAPAVPATPVVDPMAAARTAATVSWLKSQWTGIRLALSVLPIILLAALRGQHIGLVVGVYMLMTLINVLINPSMAKVMLAPSLAFAAAAANLSGISLAVGTALSACVWWSVFAFSKNAHILGLLGKISKWATQILTVAILVNFLSNGIWLGYISETKANTTLLIIGGIVILISLMVKKWLPTAKKTKRLLTAVGVICFATALINVSALATATIVAQQVKFQLGQWQWEALLLPLMVLLAIPEVLGVALLSAQKDGRAAADVNWKQAMLSMAVVTSIASVASFFISVGLPMFAISTIGVTSEERNVSGKVRKPHIAGLLVLASVSLLGFLINLSGLIVLTKSALALIVGYYLFQAFSTQVGTTIIQPVKRLVAKQARQQYSWIKTVVLLGVTFLMLSVPTVHLTSKLAPVAISIPVTWWAIAAICFICIVKWRVEKLQERRTP